jgi:hypothetical protein
MYTVLKRGDVRTSVMQKKPEQQQQQQHCYR